MRRRRCIIWKYKEKNYKSVDIVSTSERFNCLQVKIKGNREEKGKKARIIKRQKIIWDNHIKKYIKER